MTRRCAPCALVVLLCVALLSGAASTAAAAPSVSAPFELGEPVPVLDTSAHSPTVASDGERFLLAWIAQSRLVEGAVLSPAGERLHPLVPAGQGMSERPHVGFGAGAPRLAWGGGVYLIVTDTGAWRVDRLGQVLERLPIGWPLHAAPHGEGYDVAWDDGRFRVVSVSYDPPEFATWTVDVDGQASPATTLRPGPAADGWRCAASDIPSLRLACDCAGRCLVACFERSTGSGADPYPPAQLFRLRDGAPEGALFSLPREYGPSLRLESVGLAAAPDGFVVAQLAQERTTAAADPDGQLQAVQVTHVDAASGAPTTTFADTFQAHASESESRRSAFAFGATPGGYVLGVRSFLSAGGPAAFQDQLDVVAVARLDSDALPLPGPPWQRFGDPLRPFDYQALALGAAGADVLFAFERNTIFDERDANGDGAPDIFDLTAGRTVHVRALDPETGSSDTQDHAVAWTSDSESQPRVAWDGTAFQAVWIADLVSAAGRVEWTRDERARVTAAGAVTAEPPLDVASHVHTSACAGATCLLLWRGAGGVIRGRLTEGADTLGEPFDVISSDALPLVRSNGTNFLVAWTAAGGTSWSVRARTLSTTGAQSAEITVASGSRAAATLVDVATSLAQYLVVWEVDGVTSASRIGSAGAVLDPAGLTGFAGVDTVAGGPDGYVGVGRVGDTDVSLRVVRYTRAGALADECTVSGFPELDPFRTDGAVTWYFNPYGSALDVVFDGTRFLVLANVSSRRDYETPSFYYADGDVRHIRGLYVDPAAPAATACGAPFLVAPPNAGGYEQMVAAADGAGTTLVACRRGSYQHTQWSGPVTNHGRIEARLIRDIAARSLGVPCSAATDCASGFCVDGVCCEDACQTDRTDLVRCAACSVAAGGTVDGRCDARSGDPCDDGNDCTWFDTCETVFTRYTTCRGTPRPAGAPCEDGDPCTAGETCSAAQVCRGGQTYSCEPNGCRPEAACDGEGGCTGAPAPNGRYCQDEDPCTTGGRCEDGLCTGNVPTATGLPCTVDDPCLGPGVCSAAGCEAAPRSCSDGNPCTADACDPALGCVHTNVADGTACDDRYSCSVNDICTAGVCAGTEVPPCRCTTDAQCADGNPCTVDTCEQTMCVFRLRAAGTACDDGDACTAGDRCDRTGVCGGTGPLACDDGNPCTMDLCDPSTGCFQAPVLGIVACDDGDPCTTGELCQNGRCAAGRTRLCLAAGPCFAAGTCDPATGQCSNPPRPAGATCDDGDPCTLTSACDGAGGCAGSGTVTCPAIDACHLAGTCVAGLGGCTTPLAPAGRGCDDGDACTARSACDSQGRCVGSGTVVCDDGNPCTTDFCDRTSGCQYRPNQLACDDGNACTTEDRCAVGVCAGTWLVSCCTGDAACDDGNPCTADHCDTATGACSWDTVALAGTACDDGDACTDGDVCVGGLCSPGARRACPAEGTCWARADCDAASGACVLVPHVAGVSCDDGDPCTVAETCDGAGLCVGGRPRTCPAPGPCQDAGACDPATGTCVALTSPDGAACDDGNACTEGDRCVAGVCTSDAGDCDDGAECTYDFCLGVGCFHEPVDTLCDDGNLCTDDVCTGGACAHAPNALPCDDGNRCTTADRCAGGRCGGTPIAGCGPVRCLGSDGQLITCDDADPCQAARCTPDGCTYTPQTGLACDDDNPCSERDTCADGLCTGEPLAACETGSADACLGDPNVDVTSMLTWGFQRQVIEGCAEAADPRACAADLLAGHPAGHALTAGCAECFAASGACTLERCAAACDTAAGCEACFERECQAAFHLCSGLTCDADWCDYDRCLLPDGWLDCDDGSPCTQDFCVDGVCTRIPIDGLDCTDGNECTQPDGCDGGACVPGAAVDGCGDRGAACLAPADTAAVAGFDLYAQLLCSLYCETEEWGVGLCPYNCVLSNLPDVSAGCRACFEERVRCFSRSGCCNWRGTGGCDQNLEGCLANRCDIAFQACAGFGCDNRYGTCTPASAILPDEGWVWCEDGDPCTVDVFDWDTGACADSPAPDGTPCDDESPCTTDDACAAGACRGAVVPGCCAEDVDCEDGDPCTLDLCTGNACVQSPVECDDGDACSGLEQCDPQLGCLWGEPLACDDGDACNGTETCHGLFGCLDGVPPVCDDGNGCNGVETCDPARGCAAGTPPACSDGDPCNGTETCHPTLGCRPGTPLACDDGDPCNGTESCVAGQGCVRGAPLACDDGDPCTDDVCLSGTGCTNPPIPGCGGADVVQPPEDVVQPPEDVVSPPEDVVEPPVDVVTPPDDVPAPPDDTATPPEDVPTPPEDVVTPPEDVPTPPDDTATPPEDVPAPPDDTATPPEDVPAPPEDTATPPEDVPAPPDDTATPPEDVVAPPEDAPAPPEDVLAPPQDTGKPPAPDGTVGGLDGIHPPRDDVAAPGADTGTTSGGGGGGCAAGAGRGASERSAAVLLLVLFLVVFAERRRRAAPDGARLDRRPPRCPG